MPPSIWALERVLGLGDAEVSRLGDVQRGMVHLVQVRAAGLSADAVATRLRKRWMHVIYRDVYLVGRPRVEPLALATAAVMHFMGSAIVSDRLAGSLWGMCDPPPGSLVELTLVGRHAHARPGVKIRRVPTIDPAEIVRRSRLPVTSPARTLVDTIGGLDALERENALGVARTLCSDAEILGALDRTPFRRGAGTLRGMLKSGQPAMTRSRRERILLSLIRKADLPRPLANQPLLGFTVDLLWPEHKLVVEFDGWKFHGDRGTFEADRRRDQKLAAAGYVVIRVTARQLDQEPYAVIARIAAALARRATV